MENFEFIEPVNKEIFFRRHDPNDVRLGEIIPHIKYEDAAAVIVGCPQDEGVKRNGGREGARLAPQAIREQFYKLTNFGITKRIFDLGDISSGENLEETHDRLTKTVTKILRDNKKAIILGGGNDISYADGRAVSEVYGSENWLGVNIDAHFDVRADQPRNSGTPYRQLLDERLLNPNYFYEVAYQSQAASPTYYRYLQNLGVNLISLDHLQANDDSGAELRERMRMQFVHHSQSLVAFFGFDMDAVRSSDAPGVSASSPIGLSAAEFLALVSFAGKLVNTKVIEFSEVNPNFDIDNKTAKLVAIAMHRFCSLI